MSVKNDGSLNHGTRKVDFKEGDTVNDRQTGVVLNDFTTNRPSSTEVQYDENGKLKGQVTFEDPVTGSGTAQLGTADTVPRLGDEIRNEDVGFGSETFYVDDVTTEESQRGLTTYNFSFRRKEN